MRLSYGRGRVALPLSFLTLVSCARSGFGTYDELASGADPGPGSATDGGGGRDGDAVRGDSIAAGDFNGAGDGLGSSTPGGEHVFTVQASATTNQSYAHAVAAAPTGLVAYTGFYQQSADFGSDVLISNGSAEIFIAAVDGNGTPLWAKSFGTISTEQGHGITVDATGNVTAVGYFEGGVDFGPGHTYSADGRDGYVVSFTPDGDLRWSRALSSSASDSAYAAGSDPAGNVYVGGIFNGDLDFGGGIVPAAAPTPFVVSYDDQGTFRWVRPFLADTGTPDFMTGDFQGNVAVCGDFRGTLDYGTGEVTAAGSTGDMFVASLDSNGTVRWLHQLHSSGSGECMGLAVGSDDSIYVTGWFPGTVNFGDGDENPALGHDLYLAAYTRDGVRRWSRVVGGAGNDLPRGMGLWQGRLYVIGSSDAIDLGTGPLSPGVFFAAVDTGSGATRWSRSYAESVVIEGAAIASNDETFVFTGGFNDTISFGGPVYTATGLDLNPYVLKLTLEAQ